MSKSRISFGSIFLASLVLIASCARDYVTGKRTFSLVSEDQEIAMGREADPQIMAEYGVYDDPKLTAYVDSIGQAIARVSHRPNLKYTFRVVDSPIVNAFALPGGWVYFTRGILAHFNSEAELAGVMGHEVGHVVARHGAEQMSKAQLANLGLGLGAALSTEFRKISRVAEVGLGLLFLKFSRGQESESDVLGVQYSTKLGYNAHDMANFFKTISRLSGGSGQRLPDFLSTHPNPTDREARVHALAEEWQRKEGIRPRRLRRVDYLRRIEGIVYGEDPRQGFVENNMFYHPQMKFQFPVPEGWTVQNSPTSVQMMNKEQTAAIQFTLAKGANPRDAAEKFKTETRGTVVQEKSLRIHGYVAHALEMQVATQSSTLHLLSHFIAKDDRIFVFHGMTTPENFSKYAATFRGVAGDFDRLRNPAAAQKKPMRIRLKRAPRTDTVENNLRSLGVDKKQWQEVALLNGFALEDRVQKGTWLKVIGY